MRRLHYIHPKIQYPFAMTWTRLVAAELIIFGGIMLLVAQLTHNTAQDIGIYLRFGAMLTVILVFTAINFWFGTRLSHRIAGPLLQIQQALESARHGDFSTRIHMRASDSLHEIGNSVNLLMEVLQHTQSLAGELQDKLTVWESTPKKLGSGAYSGTSTAAECPRGAIDRSEADNRVYFGKVPVPNKSGKEAIA